MKGYTAMMKFVVQIAFRFLRSLTKFFTDGPPHPPPYQIVQMSHKVYR
jgi:hypothetical protein